MINKAILMGRLTTKPELKETPQGTSVTSFSIAIDRRYKGADDKADFINIVAWRTTAEFICKYFEKGQLIAISGSIQTRDYEDSNGVKRYITEVLAEEVSFAGGKENSDEKH